MNKKGIIYTDPAWAVKNGNQLDPSRADLERAILGDEIELRFGLYEDGKFIKEGPRFLERLSGAEAVVVYRARVTPEVVHALKPTCKVIARQGVGIDNLNAELLQRHGIYGFNVPDYCVEEVSTHTLSLVLALERHLCIQDRRIKKGAWDIYAGGCPRRLQQLTLGIIGFGRIGKATSRKAQAFYGSVISYDPFVHGDLMSGYGVEKREQLYDLLADSDVVVLHALLDDTTRFIINPESIRRLKAGALLVNTARGELVNPEAVLTALSEGRLGGYAADVFSPEDPNENPLNKEIMKFENVLVTSHRAFLSQQSERSLRTRVAEEIVYVLATGNPPRSGRVA